MIGGSDFSRIVPEDAVTIAFLSDLCNTAFHVQILCLPVKFRSMLDENDQLMIRLQEGDATAFTELVAIHQQPLIGYFQRNTRDWQLSEDLSQETLLRVYHQAWDFLPVGRFKPWMYRIARNLLIDTVRKRSHDALIRAYQASQEEDDPGLSRIAGEFLSPEQIANQHEFTELVDRLLEEIPDEQRQTFVLHHYVGLGLAEVAEILDSNLATSKSRLRLAREKLQEKLRFRGFETNT